MKWQNVQIQLESNWKDVKLNEEEEKKTHSNLVTATFALSKNKDKQLKNMPAIRITLH